MASKTKDVRKAAKTQRCTDIKKRREEAAAETNKDNDIIEEIKKEEDGEKQEAKSASTAVVVSNPGVSDDVLRKAMMGMMSHWMSAAATAMTSANHPASGSDRHGVKCDHCGAQGHTANYCWKKMRNNNEREGEAAGKGSWSGDRQRQSQYR